MPKKEKSISLHDRWKTEKGFPIKIVKKKVKRKSK